jgi:hypothetical protein
MISQVKGLAFPLRFANNGGLSRSNGEAKILDNVKNIVTTRIRERYLNPSFGTNVASHLFGKLGQIPLPVMTSDVQTAIRQHEPRMILLGITIDEIDDVSGTSLKINISYKIKSLGFMPEVQTSFEV